LTKTNNPSISTPGVSLFNRHPLHYSAALYRSVILNSNGNSPPNPSPGEIAFFGGHFEGWNGLAWKQLDN